MARAVGRRANNQVLFLVVRNGRHVGLDPQNVWQLRDLRQVGGHDRQSNHALGQQLALAHRRLQTITADAGDCLVGLRSIDHCDVHVNRCARERLLEPRQFVIGMITADPLNRSPRAPLMG